MIPLAGRLAVSLSRWLLVGGDVGLELRCNLDDLDALSADREALWARLDGASFLTDDEKRAAAGAGGAAGPFGPRGGAATGVTPPPGANVNRPALS